MLNGKFMTIMGSKILSVYTSSSNPGKEYQIVQGRDGVVYCTCTSWKMRKHCKHLDHYNSAAQAKIRVSAKREARINGEPDIQLVIENEIRKLGGQTWEQEGQSDPCSPF